MWKESLSNLSHHNRHTRSGISYSSDSSRKYSQHRYHANRQSTDKQTQQMPDLRQQSSLPFLRSYSLSFSPLIHLVLDYYGSRDDCMRFSNIYNHFSQNRSFSNSIEVWQIVQRLERRRLLYSALPALCTVPNTHAR